MKEILGMTGRQVQRRMIKLTRQLSTYDDMGNDMGDDYLDWLMAPISEDKQLAIVALFNLYTLDQCKGVTDRTLALHAMLWGQK